MVASFAMTSGLAGRLDDASQVSKTRLEGQFERRCCHTFLTGFGSRALLRRRRSRFSRRRRSGLVRIRKRGPIA
jgi:hypothetical protein